MKYLYLDFIVSPYSEDACDVLSAMLSEIGFDSFEMSEKGIKAYIQQDQFNEDSLKETLENKDWNAEWEQNSFDPILEREFGIRLNPRMAFGSGSHATTYQITSLLLQQDFTFQRVLDMGTGTGVLAIAMAKRGAREVVAIDIDPFSVENAQENAALNNINNVHVQLGDATAIKGLFDTIVANIHKNILTADMPTYVQHLASQGTLYISGFFTEDIPDMEKTAIKNGLKVLQTYSKDNWAVIKLVKE